MFIFRLPNVPLQPRRLIIAPSAGCKRMLAGHWPRLLERLHGLGKLGARGKGQFIALKIQTIETLEVRRYLQAPIPQENDPLIVEHERSTDLD
jgi:hypothetical protein